jgi:AcrR family transcriptional regulator
MLLHYFGSKEALISEVMGEVHAQLQTAFQDLAANPDSPDGAQLLREFWASLSSRRNRPSLQLLFEVQVLALQNPKRYCRYLRGTSASWRHSIVQALPAREMNAVSATLYSAIIDGLLLELLSTGDLRRTSGALDLFLKRCHPPSRRRRKSPK